MKGLAIPGDKAPMSPSSKGGGISLEDRRCKERKINLVLIFHNNFTNKKQGHFPIDYKI